jgi:hypothetical protein
VTRPADEIIVEPAGFVVAQVIRPHYFDQQQRDRTAEQDRPRPARHSSVREIRVCLALVWPDSGCYLGVAES